MGFAQLIYMRLYLALVLTITFAAFSNESQDCQNLKKESHETGIALLLEGHSCDVESCPHDQNKEKISRLLALHLYNDCNHELELDEKYKLDTALIKGANEASNALALWQLKKSKNLVLRDEDNSGHLIAKMSTIYFRKFLRKHFPFDKKIFYRQGSFANKRIF